MRDSIAAARRGIPSVAFVTEAFWSQGDFIATADGMPSIPRIQIPHPVAGTGRKAIRLLAARVSHDVITRLTQG